MAGLGTLTTTAIITKGMTCSPTGSVCKNGLITTHFSLYCADYVPPPIHQGAGGGPYPKDAWNKYNPGEINDFYKILPDEQQYYVVPRDQEEKYFQRHKIIKLELNFGNFRVEKEYSTPENRAKQIIKVMNVINATASRAKATVEKFKRLTTKAIVKIKNFRLLK
jgi:hypothetical protein